MLASRLLTICVFIFLCFYHSIESYATENTSTCIKISQRSKENKTIEEKYITSDGKSCMNNDGYYIVRYKHFNDGSYEHIQYPLDTKNDNACLKKGIVSKELLQTETVFITNDGKLCMGNEKFARAIINYDNKRRIIEWRFFGINDELIDNSEGYAVIQREYSDDGSYIQTSYPLGKQPQ